jgi:hypothetical protein
MNSVMRTLLSVLLASGVFCSDGQSAETPPYLLLKFRESYRDNTVLGRRSAMFTEVNGTNTCGIRWPERQNETNAARIEAILTGALEKEGTRDARGSLWKATSEIVFSVPVASVHFLPKPSWSTNYGVETDFSGWKLISPTRAEIEKSETLQRLLEAKAQSALEPYFRWNGLTNSAALRVGMKMEDAIKILGEPTHHMQKEQLVKGKPEYPFEGWLRWYYNPRDMHVAPWIRLRIEDGLVKELKAGRG